MGHGRKYLATSNALTNTLVGGWQIQTILVVRSGIPYTLSASGDGANTGVGSQRPNLSGTGNANFHPTTLHWFDASRYAPRPLIPMAMSTPTRCDRTSTGSTTRQSSKILRCHTNPSSPSAPNSQPVQHHQLLRTGHYNLRHVQLRPGHQHLGPLTRYPVRPEIQLLSSWPQPSLAPLLLPPVILFDRGSLPLPRSLLMLAAYLDRTVLATLVSSPSRRSYSR